MRVRAPAKLNLVLRVGPLRSDGYHRVSTLFQAVDLFDELELEPAAQTLVEGFPETVEMQPDLIAHHFAQAGLTEKAIEYLRKAGQRAIKHSAGADAIGHLTRVRELLQSLSAESLSENQVRKHAAFGLEMIQAARSDLAFRHASDCQTEAAM